MQSIAPRSLRDALGAFATGVAVVTAIKPTGEPAGVTVNSFTSVSLDPPLILWCLQLTSTSLSAFAAGRHFSVNLLGEHQQRIAMQFAGKAPAKFPGADLLAPDGPPPRIPGSICRIDCIGERIEPAGDHRIVLGRVVGVDSTGGAPLLFHAGQFGRFDRT
ncbi:MAG: flavin reductase family protein [Steroidobacteraceae bacterium]